MLLLIVVVFFALLLTGLLVAFIFRHDFRDAVLRGHGEATFLGLLSVKGVAIVLLCGLFIGAILFAIRLQVSPSPTSLKANAASGPIDMRLNVSFSPEVNAKSIEPKAFIKTPDGPKPIPLISKVDEGGVSIRITVPDMETPFFIVFPTFPNPVRLVCSRDNSFQLTARGWGEFKVLIKLIFQDGSIRQMSHQLEFR